MFSHIMIGTNDLEKANLIARNMVTFGSAFCVPGNHDMKLMRKLRGKDVQIAHGLANSLAEIDATLEIAKALASG